MIMVFKDYKFEQTKKLSANELNQMYKQLKKTDKLELKLVEDEISKRTQNHLKDFAKNNLEVKPKNNPENKNDQPNN